MSDRSAPPPPRPRTLKFGIVDVIVIAAVLGLFAFIIYRVNTVLVYNWDFGRIIPNYLFRWDSERERWVTNLLIQGLITTVRISIWGMLLASIIGLIMGVFRVSNVLFLRVLSRGYVELIRNIPPVVFLFVFFFFISSQILGPLELADQARNAPAGVQTVIRFLFGDLRVLPNFFAALIALALFEAAYITELVRAGIQSIEKGQWEAARSVGLSPFHVMRYVILPQAIQRITPPLANQFITLIKDSALISLISVQDLTFMGVEISNSTQRLFETWITVAVMYFVISYSLALAFGRLEKRLKAGYR